MKKNDQLSFVFFGSGPVAAKSVTLLAQHFVIEFIVTKTTTVKDMEKLSIGSPVYGVLNRRELDDLFTTLRCNSSLAVLIDFGIIVSQSIINVFPKGIINSHFSLLPELRGADPISFAILEGKEKTGVSLMKLVQAMDEGPLLAQESMTIDSEENSNSLTNKLVYLCAAMLQRNLQKYSDGEVKLINQEEIIQSQNTSPSYTRKLTKADGMIDWHKSAETIDREIRAFLSWPKSTSRFGDVDLTLTKARPMSGNLAIPVGRTLIIDDETIGVQCADGWLKIESLKPASKKEMDTRSFLAGYKNRLLN